MCRTCGKRHNSYDPTSNGPHDVSLEPSDSIPFSFTLRSPGKTSPLRSRNLKEYEEQLEHLKKENFALKLRIYFLEERMGHRGPRKEKEDLHKANIELKVETEALRKELCDKQELVRQAAALLTNLENQYKDQLQAAKDTYEMETEGLKDTIAALQKEAEEYSERLQEGGGDLTRLCGLAFSDPGDQGADLAFCNARPHSNGFTMAPTPLQGLFSMQNGSGYSSSEPPSMSPLTASVLRGQDDSIPAEAKERIKELEDEVERLTKKVLTLQESLQEQKRTSQALEEDIVNLKKEIEEREEKLTDMELEVTEKDQKVDQLMQELETRHLEIEAKDSTIQTLHDDLNKVEPQIEVKVQEIMEKDRIIEEKKEQLQQQNKILVEIQITLDEKQKQIAELEQSLLAANEKANKLDKDFKLSIQTIKEMATEVLTRDKEIAQLKKELKRKEKKVKDLLAELKEALDMYKKAKWEAETCGGQDGVKEMVEEENERLWAELEQRKLEMKTLRVEKETFEKEAEQREASLKRQQQEAEERIRALQKHIDGQVIGERDKRDEDPELASLKEKLDLRDAVLKKQEILIETMKADFCKVREELVERKDELKELKKELSRKNFDIQDFIKKELFGRSKEVKDLQEKLCKFPPCQDNSLEALKLFMEANQMKTNREDTPSKSQVQMRSNSLSKLSEQPTDTRSEKTRTSSPYMSKAGRSSSFSLLENALYANMGQKVYNTNQTFNTYVLSGEAEGKPNDFAPLSEIVPTVPKEVLKMEIASTEDSAYNPAKAFLANVLGKEVVKNIGRTIPSTKRQNSQNKENIEKDVASTPQVANISENALELLYHEVNNIRNEAKALRKDREILTEKVSALQSLNEQLASKASQSLKPVDQSEAEASSVQKQLEQSPAKEHCEVVTNVQEQVQILKGELKGIKKKVTVQLLQLASTKYQESLKNYKQEIISLRKRLADSHNACDLLRNRLEELVDFLEQILDMDNRGIISLSHLSTSQRASLQKSLDDSRSLSHSLSHSLMIGTDSLLGDNSLSLNEEAASRFCLPLDKLPEEIDLTQLENSCAAEISFNPEDLSILDPTTDSMYLSLATKINSEIDSKTQEIEAIAAKLGNVNSILESKDKKLKEQTDLVLRLKKEVSKLQEEMYIKEQQLIEAQKDVPISSLNRISENRIIVSANDSRNESNSSLHLSTLQHSLSPLNFDPRIHDGILTVRKESSSSDTLPPPSLSYFSPHEDFQLPKPSRKAASVIDTQAKNVVLPQSDIGSAYSTDIIVKGLPKFDQNSFSKNVTDVSPHSRPQGMSLEQPSLPPSFALASPSESEAWSEPDRNVSLARIGLETCNLVSASHDRSLSRSRLTRSAPFTSESDGEGNMDDTKEGSAGLATPSNKPKRRTDAAEIKRLTSKLRAVEQLNETLRAELHIYQSLNQQLGNPSKERLMQSDMQAVEISRDGLKSGDDCLDLDVSRQGSLSLEDNCSLIVSSSLFQEIRSLRMKLEEAIANNDLLRDQLEAALSGYLSEESRNLTAKLSATQQELKLNQEKLLVAAKTEEQLKLQVKESDAKTFELGERLADYMTCNQKLEKKITDLNKELQNSKESLRIAEEELKTIRAIGEEKEWTQKEIRDSKCFQMEVEINSLKMECKKLQQLEREKERKIEEQKKYISELEEAKADYESKLAEQDTAINGLCASITKLQQETSKSSISDEIVSKLQEALQNSESRLLQVTKERFALVGERARLQSQLASVTTHKKLLQREVRELSITEESYPTDMEYKQIFQRLGSAQTTIKELHHEKELFHSEKQAMQKEMQLLQEEISALRSHLDHVLSRETVTNSREVRELATLQLSFQNLKEENISLETRYKALLSDKASLEKKLDEVSEKEKEIVQLKKILRDTEVLKQDLNSQLDSERCLTRNLQMQIKNMQSSPFYQRVPPMNFESPINAYDTDKQSNKSSPCKSWRNASFSFKNSIWTEDKENRLPTDSRGPMSLPLIEDDLTSGDSPDLGIGSDGQFSSLERLGGKINTRLQQSEKKEERKTVLCSEPSHSQLLSEIEQLRQERENLSDKLVSTKESLQEALSQLSKANQKKESVERAICRQLTKTHDVLRRANGNLRQAKSQYPLPPNPSTHPSEDS